MSMGRIPNWFRGTIVATVFVLLCAGCGSGSSSSSKTRIRFLNAVPEISTGQVLVNDDSNPVLLPYGTASDYNGYNSPVRVAFFDGSSVLPLVDQTFNTQADTDLSHIFYADQNPGTGTEKVHILALHDGFTVSSSRWFAIRLVNVAPSLPSLDLYIVKPGETLGDIDPVISGINYARGSSYVEGNNDTGVLYVTQANKPENVIYVSDTVEFNEGDSYSLVLLDQPGRGLPPLVRLLNDSN